MNSLWFQRFLPRPRAQARLFCFAHAGAGGAAYRLWPGALPETFEVCAIQLPGRANRLREAPLASIPALVDALLPALRAQLDLPFAFFGHSMGAVLASEVARALHDSGGPNVRHLFVSSRRPPHLPSPEPSLHDLSDAAFVTEIDRRYGGIPPEVAQHEDLMRLLLPSLRADIAALETFEPAPGREPLACPISVFGGEADRLAPREQLDAWRDVTTGAFRLRMFPGDHFYLQAQHAPLLADIAAQMQLSCAPALAGLETA